MKARLIEFHFILPYNYIFEEILDFHSFYEIYSDKALDSFCILILAKRNTNNK